MHAGSFHPSKLEEILYNFTIQKKHLEIMLSAYLPVTLECYAAQACRLLQPLHVAMT